MIGEKNDLKSAEAPIGPLVTAFAKALGVSAEALSPAARGFATQAQDDWSPPRSCPNWPSRGAGRRARRLLDLRPRARKGTAPNRPSACTQAGDAGLDRLEIVQDDRALPGGQHHGRGRPRQGLSVRAMFHPIVGVARDRKGVRAETGTPRR
jgi:glutamate dehydrogenase